MGGVGGGVGIGVDVRVMGADAGVFKRGVSVHPV